MSLAIALIILVVLIVWSISNNDNDLGTPMGDRV